VAAGDLVSRQAALGQAWTAALSDAHVGSWLVARKHAPHHLMLATLLLDVMTLLATTLLVWAPLLSPFGPVSASMATAFLAYYMSMIGLSAMTPRGASPLLVFRSLARRIVAPLATAAYVCGGGGGAGGPRSRGYAAQHSINTRSSDGTLPLHPPRRSLGNSVSSRFQRDASVSLLECTQRWHALGFSVLRANLRCVCVCACLCVCVAQP
jgi:hypothetical protein